MKKFLIIFLLTSITGISQSSKIPKINFHTEIESENIFLELLNISDKNSLIIKIGYSSYWSKGLNAKYIVYHNNGEVQLFEAYHPSSLSNSKQKIEEKKIKKSDYKYYWGYLNLCIAKNKFKIDQSKLNITDKKGVDKEKGTLTTKIVSDGTNFTFGIYQGSKYTTYSSYAPNEFIKDKYPGYEDRQKLVDLINGFEYLIENN